MALTRWLLVLAIALICFAPAAAWGQQDRINGRIDTSHAVVLKGKINTSARMEDDRGEVDPSMEIAYATLRLQPTAAQQAALERLLMEQQDPGSANYHRWLTPEEYGDRFGLSRGDLAKIAGWLESQGLRVNDVARGRHWITFTGPAGAMGRTFRTEFHYYATNGMRHFANVTAPSIPEALAGVVAGVEGLDDYDAGFTVAERPLVTTTSGTHYLAPDDIATIYDVNPLYAAGIDGTGQTIAVIGATGFDMNQIHTYRSRYNLTTSDPKLMLVGPDPGTVAEDEVYLDLELVSAVARNANIVYVYAKSMDTAARYAVDQRVAPVITESHITCEPGLTSDQRAIAQQANAEGITWVAASGDAGAAGCETQGKLPQASTGKAVGSPASIPEVTAVGGTEFDDAAGTYWSSSNTKTYGSATSYIPERAWNDTSTLDWALAASTGGASILYAKPWWQTGAGVPDDGARDVPDVALSASWSHDGYYIYASDRWYGQGGTSAATPVFASFVVLLNQYLLSKNAHFDGGLGNINPTLYRLAQTAPAAFHDITKGDNIVPCMQGTPDCGRGSFGYTAGAGYDLVTGLGSVDLYKLASSWNSGTPTNTAVSASPASVAFNGSFQLTASVSASGAVPGGEIAFIANDTSLGTATLSAGSATLTVNAGLLPAGANTITAIYSGAAGWNGSSGATTVSVTVPAGASAVVASMTPNPVYEVRSSGGGTVWDYTIHLTNESAIAATLTKFTIDGNDDLTTLKNALGSATIGGNASVSATLAAANLKAPVNRVFVFAGTDASGAAWSQQITVPFIARVLEENSLVVTTPASVPSNASADASCRWSQPIVLEEQGGIDLQLASLVSGGNDFSNQMQQIFGATSMAPFGRLQGTLCWPAGTTAGAKTATLSFTDTAAQQASTRTVTFATTLSAGAAAGTASSVSPTLVRFSGGGSSQKSTIALSFAGGSPAWTARVSPAGSITSWLTVAPLSGSGGAQLTVTASSAGLANGVYNANILIQSANATPQFLSVPVVLLVGGSSSISIGGVTNAASYQTVLAPGMLATVFGTNMAPAVQHAPAVPLPLSMQGVTVTVNGYTAPLLDVSPGQLNVQIPYETGAGTAILGVNNGGQVAYFALQVEAAAPGIFMTGDGNSNLVPYAGGARGQELVAFITGEGAVAPWLMTGRTPTTSDLTQLPAPGLPASISVGGVQATIDFIGIPPGFVGVTQINFKIPANAPVGKQPVVVTVGGVASAPVNVTVSQ